MAEPEQDSSQEQCGQGGKPTNQNNKHESLLLKTFKKSRTKASPWLSVSDIQTCLQNFLDDAKTNDLAKLITPPDNVGWKTAAHVKYLSKMEPLLSRLLQVAPNTVLHSRKVREAVQNLCQEKGISTSSKRNPQDFSDWCDDVIRMCLAQLRDLKANTQNLSRALRKGTPMENEKIRAMLDKVNFQENWSDGGGTTSNSASPKTPTTHVVEDGEVVARNESTAIVPWCRVHAEKQMQSNNLPGAEEGAAATCQQQLTSTSFLLSKLVLFTAEIAFCTQMISYSKTDPT